MLPAVARSTGVSVSRVGLRGLALVGAFAAAGCATPMTQVGSVTHEQIETEQLKEAQLAIT